MSDTRMSDTELLKYAVENGIIDTALLHKKIEMQKKEEILKKHQHKIWEGSDGCWHTYLPDKENGRIRVKKKSIELLHETIIHYYSEEKITLAEAFKEYNESRAENEQISKSSLLRYQQDFDRFYGQWKDRCIKSITADELCDYMEHKVSELKLSSKSFSGFKTITRGFFKRAYRKKLVPFRVEEVLSVIDISDKKLRKKQFEDNKEVFSEEEFCRYVNMLSQNQDIWNLALLLILVTGLRGGEVVALKREDIIQKDDVFTIFVNRTETRYKVDGKYVYDIKEAPKTEAGIRYVVVPKQFNWLCKTLLIRSKQGNYVFLNPQKGNRLTTNSLRRRQERNCIKLKMCQKSPHKGRKTYCTILLDSNIDQNMIKGQVGHADIHTTEQNYHRNMKSIEKKAEILSDIAIFDKSC